MHINHVDEIWQIWQVDHVQKHRQTHQWLQTVSLQMLLQLMLHYLTQQNLFALQSTHTFRSSVLKHHHHNHFTALFPGPSTTQPTVSKHWRQKKQCLNKATYCEQQWINTVLVWSTASAVMSSRLLSVINNQAVYSPLHVFYSADSWTKSML